MKTSTYKKFLAKILIVSMLVLQAVPMSFVFAVSNTNIEPIAFEEKPKVEIPAVPEERTQVDWSAVNWNQEIILPRDEDDFYNRIEELTAQGREEEIERMELKKYKMSDDTVLDYYNVPLKVRDIVYEYRERVGALSFVDPLELKKYNKHIGSIIKDLGFGPDERIEESLDETEFSEYEIVEPNTTGKYEQMRIDTVPLDSQEKPTFTVESVSGPAKNNFSLETVTLEALAERAAKEFNAVEPQRKEINDEGSDNDSGIQPLRKEVMNIFQRIKHALFGVETAHAEPTTPFIKYYDGIEDYPVDFGFYYLSNVQNQDGSFGRFNKYEITGAIALTASSAGMTDNTQFISAVNYLKNTTPVNNKEKAIKARLMVGLKQPYKPLLDDVLKSQNEDGGFGIDPGYRSDVDTTLEMIAALYAGNYSIEDGFPKAIAFVMNNVKADGTMRYTVDGAPSFYLMNKTAQTLYPFKHLFVGSKGGPKVKVQTKTDPILAYLNSAVDSEGNLTGSDDVIDMAMTARTFLLYQKHAAKRDALRKQVVRRQYANGSFGSSLYATFESIRALEQPDLVLTALSHTGSLINKETATLKLSIKNRGQRAITNAKIYTFIDNVNVNHVLDLAANKVVIKPQKTVTLIIPITNTVGFIGNTDIKFYVEGIDEARYDNNWIEKDFVFTPAKDGKAAMPLYYVAHPYTYKDNSGTYRAGLAVLHKHKDDPNRNNYIMRWRKKGTTKWLGTGPSKTSGGGALFKMNLTPGEVYEVTAGVVHKKDFSATYYTDLTTVVATNDNKKYVGGLEGVITVHNKPTEGLDASGYSFISGGKMTSDRDGKITHSRVGNGSNIVRVQTEQYDPIWTRFIAQPGKTTKNVRVFTKLKKDTQKPIIKVFEIRNMGKLGVINQREANVFVEGEDNVALKEAEFYYWSPKTKVWSFLGKTAMDSNGIQASLKWFVPKDVVGEGHKVKAVLIDYQGNRSDAKEFAFKATDGTLPTGTVTVQNLKNNTWSIGDTKKITWNIVSPNKLLSLNVRLYYGDNGMRVIKSNYNVNNTSVDYFMPISSSYVGDKTYIQLQVCDVNYNCADINSPIFKVDDNTAPPLPPWQKPKVFEGIISKYGQDRILEQVFHNPDGSIEIIYREFIGQYHDSKGQNRKITYRKYANGSWQTPIVLADYWYKQGTTAKVQYRKFDVVRDNKGEIHMVYERVVGEWPTSSDATEVYYIHMAKGKKVVERNISNSSIGSGSPEVVVSSTGVVSIIWREGYSAAKKGGKTLLWTVQGDGANSWSSRKALTDDITPFASITLNGSDPTVIYKSKDQFFIREKKGSSWKAAVPIHNPYIAKKTLDAFAEDKAKFDKIVKQDPNDATQYTWLPSIKTLDQLTKVLTDNNFTKKNQIIDAWKKQDFSSGIWGVKLFAQGNGLYDAIYRFHSPESNYRYDIRTLRTKVDSNSGTHDFKYYEKIVEREGKDDVRSFVALQRPNGSYNIFYVKTEYQPNGSQFRRARHFVLDGKNPYFDKRTSAIPMTVTEQILAGVQQGDKLMIFFSGYISGEKTAIYNTADYTTLIDYRIDPISPKDKQTNVNSGGTFEWKTTGGSIDTYDVLLGTNRSALQKIKTGLQTTKHAMPTLQSNTTYYWQVVGHKGNNRIDSSVWSFVTGNLATPVMTIEDAGKAIQSGATHTFAKQLIKTKKSATMTIKNAGAGNLVLSGNPLVSIVGNDAKEFAITKQPGSSVAANGSTSFDVAFEPTTPGQKVAQLKITHNDKKVTNPFVINLKGEAVPFFVTLSADKKSGKNPLGVDFTGSVSGGSILAPVAIDFSKQTIKSSGGSADATGKITIKNNGNEIDLTGSTSKFISIPYNVTKNTMLELEFKSAKVNNNHGIGVKTKQGTVYFQFAGSDVGESSDLNYYDYAGNDWQTYKIQLGQFVTGSTEKLTFVSGALSSNSAFKNVKIYESNAPAYVYSWDFNNDGKADVVGKDQQKPYHTFTKAGTHKVVLSVSDGTYVVKEEIEIVVSG